MPELETRPRLLGICGPSGSGKTELAKALAGQGGGVVISLDAYFKDPAGFASVGDWKNWEGPDCLDFEAFYQCVAALRDGRAATDRVFDWIEFTWQPRPVAPKDLIIAEGALLFCDRRLVELADLRVYIDLDPEACLARRLSRLSPRSAARRRFSEEYLRTVVYPGYEPRRAHFATMADVVLNGDRPVAALLDEVTRHLAHGPAAGGISNSQVAPVRVDCRGARPAGGCDPD